MKRFFCSIFLICSLLGSQASDRLPGFVTSPYFEEQEMAFTYAPEVEVRINAPAAAEFDRSKPTKLVLYALPNGNSIDWTIGKLPAANDDWHFHIQHIGAQTRYLRTICKEYNLVTVYLKAESGSWGRWRSAGPDRKEQIKGLVEYLRDLFSDYNPHIELNSHSGGGNFIFGFMDAVSDIPDYITKISFIDSNYGWDKGRYGKKLTRWLDASPENSLFVACYDDANALLDGKPFVSKKGGTWYKTLTMRKYLKKHMKQRDWNEVENDSIIYTTDSRRKIQLYSRKNPERKIYHTVLVERNGFIQSVLAGTEYESRGYRFMGGKAYDSYRQDSIIQPHIFRFPPRKKDAMSGSGFAIRARHLSAKDRDSLIYHEIAGGNIPDNLRQPVFITDSLADAEGRLHEVTLCLLADFLAVGNDTDFLRIPTLPLTAQRLADLYGASLPTRKMSDLIHRHSRLKLNPHPMTPDSTMTTVPAFARHDSIIENARRYSRVSQGVLIAGHKKDIVITNRIAGEPDRLFIYGWHYPDGVRIQPLSAAHGIGYVDYSHGVRLVRNEILVDDKIHTIQEVLQHPVLYKLLSDEDGPMTTVCYVTP